MVGFCAFAQKNVFLKIAPKVNGNDLVLGANNTDTQGTVFSLNYFNYYLSDLHVIHDGGQDLNLSDTVFLVKSDSFILYLGYIDITNIESLSFFVGVPTDLNTQTGANAIDISMYPAGHPLSFQDPSMYWGWSSGYMFLVTAGNADSNSDGITDAYFELSNLGGHNYVGTSLPVVQTNVGNDQVDVYLDCNIEQWLKGVPLQTIGILHGTLGYNESSMANVASEPVFTQPLNAGTSFVKAEFGEIYNYEDLLYWKGFPENCQLTIVNPAGKKCLERKNLKSNDQLSLDQMNAGIYFVNVTDSDGLLIRRIKVLK